MKKAAKTSHEKGQEKSWKSTGPKSSQGKKRVSKNSEKHGFYSLILRDFRKHRRSKSLRGIEGLFKNLIRENEPGKIVPILDKIIESSNAYEEAMGKKKELTPEEVLEALYLDLTIVRLANHKMHKTVIQMMNDVGW